MQWTADLAYAVGLITSDGSLSKDQRHIDFTSKDLELIHKLAAILNLTNKIGKKEFKNRDKVYYRLQFGDVVLYRFLEKVGLTPNKSNSLSTLCVPDNFFRDFLRGYFDGDGFSYSYWDVRWKSSFCLYSGFVSGSKEYLEWIRKQVLFLFNLEGSISKVAKTAYQLKYSKNATAKLFKQMYYTKNVVCLERKRKKLAEALNIIKDHAGVLKLVYRHA